MSKASDICEKAAGLVSVSRQEIYGDMVAGHESIAAFWNVWLSGRGKQAVELTAHDAAVMMALLKIARLKSPAYHPDNYVDLAGYAGVAGEIALKSFVARRKDEGDGTD